MSKPQAIISFNPIFRFFARFTFLLIAILVTFAFPIMYKIKIRGRKNLHLVKKGAVSISNHCTYLDPGLIGLALYRKRIHFSGTEKAFRVKGLNLFVRLLGGFPIPAENPGAITPYVRKALKKGDWVHFYAEGDLYDYNQEVLPLMDGAFFYSLRENLPVVPVAIVLQRRYFFKKEITRPFPKITIEIGEPIYPSSFKEGGASAKLVLKNMSSHCQAALQELIDKNNGDKTLYEGQIQHRI